MNVYALLCSFPELILYLAVYMVFFSPFIRCLNVNISFFLNFKIQTFVTLYHMVNWATKT
jgi:hypothetical protein